MDNSTISTLESLCRLTNETPSEFQHLLSGGFFQTGTTDLDIFQYAVPKNSSLIVVNTVLTKNIFQYSGLFLFKFKLCWKFNKQPVTPIDADWNILANASIIRIFQTGNVALNLTWRQPVTKQILIVESQVSAFICKSNIAAKLQKSSTLVKAFGDESSLTPVLRDKVELTDIDANVGTGRKSL
jgi:hypothetical protein